jgi:hypothetical protein
VGYCPPWPVAGAPLGTATVGVAVVVVVGLGLGVDVAVCAMTDCAAKNVIMVAAAPIAIFFLIYSPPFARRSFNEGGFRFYRAFY